VRVPTFFTLLVLTAPLIGACTPESSAAASEEARVEREVRDLMRALTPLDPAALPVARSEWHLTRRRTTERARTLSRDFGSTARRILVEERPEQEEVRVGLLDAAAHCDPEGTEDLLVQLVLTYSDELLVRGRAAELLGETRPERGLEVLEPILREQWDGRTYPAEEKMLNGYLAACQGSGHDPAPVLALIATDIQRQQDVRHLATKTLGDFDTPLSRQALRNIMTESTGNSMIRRFAVQSLRKLLPKEEFCPLVKQVQGHEADEQMILFLESMLNENCR
jgi:HEAT repeat protein